jgi:serine protease AprX
MREELKKTDQWTKVSLSLLFSILSISGFSQEKYWVYFKEKTKSNFNPETYFDIHALQRRMAIHANLSDSADWPVNAQSVTLVQETGAKTGFQSRWLNAVSVEANQSILDKIAKLSCVRAVQPMQYFKGLPASIDEEVPLVFDNALLDAQIRAMHGEEFIMHGIDGKGIRIAVFDGGFPGVDKNPIFQHLRDNKQIIKTYDFVKKTDFVYDYMTHGTSVLSCIAGIYGGKNVGLATGAEYLLARTEIKPELKVEEEYWMAAVEWADQNGADIISSSLGYTDKRYTVKQMNGHSTLVSEAARIAARKGMLVVNAMGNDGRGAWEVMGAPADVDSVLSVGGTDPITGYHIAFSSFGPTADLRLKPNICAPGAAMVASSSGIKKAFGTSFSTPLISGFAACVWQMNRSKNNMEIFHLMEQSGHLYPYFDYAHGYGIPQGSWFFKQNDTTKMKNPIILEKTELGVNIRVTDLSKSLDNYKDYLYYHIQNAAGALEYYAVLEVNQNEVVSVPIEKLVNNSVLRVYYKGCVSELKF